MRITHGRHPCRQVLADICIKTHHQIADIFNDVLAYKLYQVKRKAAPYGVYYYKGKQSNKGYLPTFNGGVGTSCYYLIAEFFGGKFEKISWGKTFDVFQYVDKSRGLK